MTSVYFINLARSKERACAMKEHLATRGIAAVRVVAVDGRELTAEQWARYDPRPREGRGDPALTSSEVACFLSHRKVWKAIANSGRAGLILEDDARLAENAASLLTEAQPYLACADVIRWNGYRARIALPLARLSTGRAICLLVAGPGGACAYMLTPHGARRLLALSKRFSEQIDTFLDHVLLRGVITLAILPYPAFLSDAAGQSTIGDERLQREREARKSANVVQRIRRRFCKACRSARKVIRLMLCGLQWPGLVVWVCLRTRKTGAKLSVESKSEGFFLPRLAAQFDMIEWVCLVTIVYFMGLAVYVHEMTYGSGSVIISENMPCCCFAEDGRTPIECGERGLSIKDGVAQ